MIKESFALNGPNESIYSRTAFQRQFTELRESYNLAVEALQDRAWNEASHIFTGLAENGHPSATFNLGLMHLMGRCEDLDIDRGVELMKQAQVLGHRQAGAFVSLADRYECGIPEDTSVVRMIVEAGGDFPDGLLIRALATSFVASMDLEDASDYWIVEVDALRHTAAGLGFLSLNDWTHFNLEIFKDSLAKARGRHGAVCSESIAQMVRVLPEVFDWPEARIMFIRCSVAALVWNGAGHHPSIPRLKTPGLAFYEVPPADHEALQAPRSLFARMMKDQ